MIILRSESTRRRVTRGMRPRRAASRMMRASPVVSIQPHQGGSVHEDVEAGWVDEEWAVLGPWEAMSLVEREKEGKVMATLAGG